MKIVVIKLYLLFLFSVDFLVFAYVITALFLYVAYNHGFVVVPTLIKAKMLLSILGFALYYKWKAKQLTFYFNVGITRRQIVLFLCVVDIVFWFIGLSLILQGYE